MDRGAGWDPVHGFEKDSDTTEHAHIDLYRNPKAISYTHTKKTTGEYL